MASGSPIPSHVAVLEDFKTLKRVADRLHTMPLLQQHYESHIAGIRVTNPDVDELLEAFDRMVPVAAVELTFQGQPKLQMPRAVGIKFLALETGYHLVDHFANIWLKSVGVPHFRGRKDQSGRLDMDAYSIMTKETFADLIAYPLTSIIAMSIPAIAPGVILTAETAHVSFLSEFRRVLGQQRARDVEYKFNLDNSTMLDLEAFHNEYLRFCSFIFQRARDSIAKGEAKHFENRSYEHYKPGWQDGRTVLRYGFESRHAIEMLQEKSQASPSGSRTLSSTQVRPVASNKPSITSASAACPVNRTQIGNSRLQSSRYATMSPPRSAPQPVRKNNNQGKERIKLPDFRPPTSPRKKVKLPPITALLKHQGTSNLPVPEPTYDHPPTQSQIDSRQSTVIQSNILSAAECREFSHHSHDKNQATSSKVDQMPQE